MGIARRAACLRVWTAARDRVKEGWIGDGAAVHAGYQAATQRRGGAVLENKRRLEGKRRIQGDVG